VHRAGAHALEVTAAVINLPAGVADGEDSGSEGEGMGSDWESARRGRAGCDVRVCSVLTVQYVRIT
jgi:hypothetical protein